MTKEHLISFLLLFAFSIGLAHDSIPHHHHDIEEIKHHVHDATSDHHEHDHKHSNEQGYFAHINHGVNRPILDHSIADLLARKYSDKQYIPIGYLSSDSLLPTFGMQLFFFRKNTRQLPYIHFKQQRFPYVSPFLRGPPFALNW